MMKPIDYKTNPASFKDPAGFVFHYNNKIFRQVNKAYASDYELLMQSGLYETLTEKKLLIPHTESTENICGNESWYKTLIPEHLPFISYPYEWSFDMLKDAALLTLRINKIALKHGMILKDASSYNIQFYKGLPIFIDTLSFEKYDSSKAWKAYRQFCEMFLFPLYIQHYLKTDLNKILSVFSEGIPSPLTVKLLPFRSYFNLGVWLHVRLHNSLKREPSSKKEQLFNHKKLLQLLEHLRESVKGLIPDKRPNSEWSNYYKETILSREYLEEKEKVFREFLKELVFDRSLDIGANDGYFSKILAERGKDVLAIDLDTPCINRLYNSCKELNLNNLYPLSINIANPSAGSGFNNTEHSAFLQRGSSDLVIALAVIHHLVLTMNIPFQRLSSFFAALTKAFLIIEFVPLDDDKVKNLLKNKSVFHLPYNESFFEAIFEEYFHVLKKQKIGHSERTLYLMQLKYLHG